MTVPRPAVGLILTLIGIHVLMMILPADAYRHVFLALSFAPFVSSTAQAVYGSATNIFLHGDFWHLLTNVLWLVLISAPVVLSIGAVRYWILILVSGIAGAWVHAAFNWGEPFLLIGISGAVFGLLGAGAHINAFGGAPNTDRRTAMVQYVLLLMIINIGWAVIGGPHISWEAHAGGFFAGLLIYPLLRRRGGYIRPV